MDSTSATRPARGRPPRLGSGQAILQAAATLFLRNGYLGTSVDDIAALAHVSKQTVYTHFADKEQLFAELIRGNFGRADQFIQFLTATLTESQDLAADLRAVARRYLAIVVQPETVRLRRLVIGEAGRFPELARSYYEQVPQRVIAALAHHFQQLADRRLLRADDPRLVANHFAWLVLGAPLDEAMFLTELVNRSASELDALADAAVNAFLAAYAQASVAGRA